MQQTSTWRAKVGTSLLSWAAKRLGTNQLRKIAKPVWLHTVVGHQKALVRVHIIAAVLSFLFLFMFVLWRTCLDSVFQQGCGITDHWEVFHTCCYINSLHIKTRGSRELLVKQLCKRSFKASCICGIKGEAPKGSSLVSNVHTSISLWREESVVTCFACSLHTHSS